MIEAQVQVNSEKVEKSIARFAEANRVEFRIVLYEQMRLWLKDLIRRSPPFNSGSMVISKMAGDRAIKNDIKKLFFTDEDIHADWTTPKAPGYVIIKLKDGAVFAVEQSKWNPASTFSQMSLYHEKNRNPRTGRVRGRGVFSGKAGAFMVVDRMMVKDSGRANFIEQKQKNSGKLAAGWLSGFRYWSHKAKAPATVPPSASFIEAHPSMGSFVNALDPSNNGYISSSNNVPYARTNRAARMAVDFTWGVREKDMAKYAALRLEKLIARFNAGELMAA